MRGGRTQSERDATTLELVFAAITGALLAAAGFVAVLSPVLAGAAHGSARKGCVTGAVILAAALFCGRVALTLRRFERQNRLHWRDPHYVDEPRASSAEESRTRPTGVPARPGRSGPES
ncbi:DUF6332 family protein [Actinacidiphila yeochonensis]|uniref:DUF6332 family protein n=1 Tax=Actinacidiphila yeochonensis TaxID=89050 RepID=UPI0012FF42DC|nr:DUF6332 family protein [Actinacidiphila yeochonensis]